MDYKVVAERMRSGKWLAMPEHGCGSCGWTPHPWTATYGNTEKEAIANYIRNHKRHLS